MAFQWTISRKLAGLTGLALAFVVAVGGTGYLAAARLIAAGEEIVHDGETLRYQMQADMAHDALRADVLAALELGMRPDEERRKAIREDLAEHSARFRTSLQQLELRDHGEGIREALRQLRPALDAYLALATAMVTLSTTDLPAALAKQAEFAASFRKV